MCSSLANWRRFSFFFNIGLPQQKEMCISVITVKKSSITSKDPAKSQTLSTIIHSLFSHIYLH